MKRMSNSIWGGYGLQESTLASRRVVLQGGGPHGPTIFFQPRRGLRGRQPSHLPPHGGRSCQAAAWAQPIAFAFGAHAVPTHAILSNVVLAEAGLEFHVFARGDSWHDISSISKTLSNSQTLSLGNMFSQCLIII